MNLQTIFGAFQPQANASAVTATNAALDAAAARPFSVVLSVDDTTKAWLTVLVAGVVALLVYRHA